MKRLSHCIVVFNRIDARILVFIVLSVFFLGFRLKYNEEQYFAYAKAFMDKDWMPGSFLFTDFPGTRLLFQYIAGLTLRFLTFEQLTLTGRMAMFMLYAFPVAALAQLLKFNNVLLVFWLSVLYMPQQNFFGGEWIFGGLESKSVAYLFILWSLYYLLKEDLLRSVLFAALATYWHFLAAGWFGLNLFIFMIIYHRSAAKKMFWYWTGYILIQIPLLIYLFAGLMEDKQSVINSINTNYVYTFIRNPHHIGIFQSLDYFYHHHFYKVLLAIVALILAIRVFRHQSRRLILSMNRMMMIIIIQILLFVPVAWLDKQGSIMKFYPFRESVIAMLLFQLILLTLFRDRWIPALYRRFGSHVGKKRWYLAHLSAIMTVFLITFGLKIVSRIENFQHDRPEMNDLNQLADVLHKTSAPGDQFLFLCGEDDINTGLPRKAERDCYFYFKFIPTTPGGIYKWYLRYTWKNKLMEHPELIPEFEVKNAVPYIVTCKELNAGYLTLLTSNTYYRLYRYEP